MFFGKSSHTLDDKGRLSLPARHRKCIGNKIFLNADLSGEYVEIVMQKTHDERQLFLNSFNEFDLEAKQLKIVLNAQTYELKLDSAGRINIPQELINSVKLKKEVVVIGNGDRIVVWNKTAYNNKFERTKVSANTQMQKLAQKLSQKAYDNK